MIGGSELRMGAMLQELGRSQFWGTRPRMCQEVPMELRVTMIQRRWAVKFCLHCNIFIYIRHTWIKPVLCSRMVSLFHRTSPWTHTCYSPHPVHMEMEEFSDARFKQRAVIESLTAEKVSPIEIHRRMKAVYGDQCVDVSTLRRWVRWSLQWGMVSKTKHQFFKGRI